VTTAAVASEPSEPSGPSGPSGPSRPSEIAEPPPAAPSVGVRPDPADLPAGTTTRFVLLLVAVVATGSLIFNAIYLAVPSKSERFDREFDACTAQAAQIIDGPARTTAEVEAQRAAWKRYNGCVTGLFLDEASWTGYGLGLMFGLAGIIYLMHPRWSRRRGGLVEFPDADDTDLRTYLDRRCDDVGLADGPTWYLAPDAARVGALAFGRAGDRAVRLDNGLVRLYEADEPRFRAIVLHELAHLRNRDVDKAYLTIAIWWAFVAVAFVPMLLLAVQPRLLYGPSNWRQWGVHGSWTATGLVLGSLLALTALVYLTRNAILRLRESHADAVAATHNRKALACVIRKLPEQPRWRRLGTHPSKEDRAAVVKEPAKLLRIRAWELFGVGLAAGTLGTNLNIFTGQLFVFNSALGAAAIAVPIWSFMIGALVAGLWRVTDPRAEAGPWPRLWLVPAAALVAGYVVGEPLSLDNAFTGWRAVTDEGGWRTLAVASSALLVAVVAVVGWVISVARRHPRSAARHRRAPLVLGAVAVVATAPWFAGWFLTRHWGRSWSVVPGDPPVAGASIGWYHALARWSGLDFGPLVWIMHIPFTLPALTLLWAAPVLSAYRRDPAGGRRTIRLGMPLIVGAALAVAAVATAVAFVYLAKSALPLAVRTELAQLPRTDTDAVDFAVVEDRAYIAVAALAQAVAAGIVSARARRYRPALGMLAASVTALLTTAALFTVVVPVSLCSGLLGDAPSCFQIPPAGVVVWHLHAIAVKGAVLAAAATVLGALIQRRRRPGADDTPPATTASRVTIAGILVLLATAYLTAAAAGLPDAYRQWFLFGG
jgi:hypothetical protein